MNPPATPSSSRPLLYTVYFIYFFCGLTLCFEGAFNPEFKDYFQLGYQQQMYTMFAKNIPFALAVGIGFLIPRLGYKNCLTIGMALFAAGTLLLVPGLGSGSYAVVLVAFFIIGLGFSFQLVAGNPMLSALGPADGSSSRLNLGNALGAVAQILGPVTLTLIIPATVVTAQDKLPYMKGLFTVIGMLLLGIALLTWLIRTGSTGGLEAAVGNAGSPPTGFPKNKQAAEPAALPVTKTGETPVLPAGDSHWLKPKLLFGFVTIFLVLGAEAGLFGLFRNYLEDPEIAGLNAHQSQRLFTVYFALYAGGRLIGSALQKKFRPALTLLVGAMAALASLGIIVTANGLVAILAVTAIGFFVSIFFPTIYALAIEGLGEQTAKASGLLTMGFLGCAVLPVMQGWLADQPGVGLQRSYALSFLAYVAVLAYAWTHRACAPAPRNFR
jgi:FHS family L-fucose permease-like MFS transporter